MAYIRFSIPEYDYKQFNGLSWKAPDLISLEETDKLSSIAEGGCFPVDAPSDVLERLDIRGEHCHAVMCVVPSSGTHLLGRSWAWWKQRVVIIDSLVSDTMNVLHDWRTPRSMNTRLGPENGVPLSGGTYFIITCHQYDDHWLGNRTVLDNEWDGADADNGFRILATSKDSSEDFSETCLTFTWND